MSFQDTDFNFAISILQKNNELLKTIIAQIKSDQKYYRDSFDMDGISEKEKLVLLGAYVALAKITELTQTNSIDYPNRPILEDEKEIMQTHFAISPELITRQQFKNTYIHLIHSEKIFNVLTNQELKLVNNWVSGKTYKEIAKILKISEENVKEKLKKIEDKFRNEAQFF